MRVFWWGARTNTCSERESASRLQTGTPRLNGYILGPSPIVVFVWAASALDGEDSSGGLRELSCLLAGMSRPAAEVVDTQALRLFLMTLVYLVWLSVGAFAAARP